MSGEPTTGLVSTYREFREYRPLTARGRLRHVALSGLAALNRSRRAPENSLSFLVFHYLFGDNERAFRQLVGELAESFRFVSASDAVTMVREGNITGRNLCFTCDDGFDNFADAARIIQEFGGSACVFVCPRFVEAKSGSEVEYYNRDRLRGPPVGFLSWRELEVLKRDGHEIGNHTLDHRNLGTLAHEEVTEAIHGAADTIRRELGECRHFACPYGYPASFNESALEAAFETGHESFFTTGRVTYGPGDLPAQHEGGGLVLKRKHFEPFWPVSHTRYFVHRGR